METRATDIINDRRFAPRNLNRTNYYYFGLDSSRFCFRLLFFFFFFDIFFFLRVSVFPRFSYGGGQARMEIRVEEESCITEYRARINLLGKLNFVRMECVNIYI